MLSHTADNLPLSHFQVYRSRKLNISQILGGFAKSLSMPKKIQQHSNEYFAEITFSLLSGTVGFFFPTFYDFDEK